MHFFNHLLWCEVYLHYLYTQVLVCNSYANKTLRCIQVGRAAATPGPSEPGGHERRGHGPKHAARPRRLGPTAKGMSDRVEVGEWVDDWGECGRR